MINWLNWHYLLKCYHTYRYITEAVKVAGKYKTSSAGAEISDGPHKGALQGLDQSTLSLCII